MQGPYCQSLLCASPSLMVAPTSDLDVGGEQTHLARFGHHRRPRVHVACFTQSTISLPYDASCLLQCGAEIVIKHYCLRPQESVNVNVQGLKGLSVISNVDYHGNLGDPSGRHGQSYRGQLLWLGPRVRRQKAARPRSADDHDGTRLVGRPSNEFPKCKACWWGVPRFLPGNIASRIPAFTSRLYSGTDIGLDLQNRLGRDDHLRSERMTPRAYQATGSPPRSIHRCRTSGTENGRDRHKVRRILAEREKATRKQRTG